MTHSQQLIGLVAVATIRRSNSCLMVATVRPATEAIPVMNSDTGGEVLPALRPVGLPPLRPLGTLPRDVPIVPDRPTTFAAPNAGAINCPLSVVHDPVGAS